MLLLLSLTAGCQSINQQSAENGKATLIIKTIGNTTTEDFDRVGMTALQMLQEKHKTKSSFGFAVRCVDDVCAEGGYWWPMYVNGELSSVGSQSYIVKNNDKIEFVLSKK